MKLKTLLVVLAIGAMLVVGGFTLFNLGEDAGFFPRFVLAVIVMSICALFFYLCDAADKEEAFGWIYFTIVSNLVFFIIILVSVKLVDVPGIGNVLRFIGAVIGIAYIIVILASIMFGIGYLLLRVYPFLHAIISKDPFRNFGNRPTKRCFSLLDIKFSQWKRFVRSYARDNKIPIREASQQLNQILVQHHEGKTKTAVPQIIDNIVKTMRDFFEENIVIPILKENQQILNQSLLFNIPSDLADKGFLDQDHRTEIEAGRANFDKFMRLSDAQWETKGVVQGFVQDNKWGKIYAVFVNAEVYYDPETQQTGVIPRSDTYTLESPFGDIIDGDVSMLLGDNPDYTLVAYRDPNLQKWEGKRDFAKQLWNSEVSSGMPDPIRDAFDENGIPFPVSAKFIYSKTANIQQWEVQKDGHELFRIRRLVPPAEKTVETPYGKLIQYSQIHPAYNEFIGKLLVYKAGEVHDPIFVFRGRIPHKVWSPIENYFPHVVDWNEVSPDPRDKTKYEKFVAYAHEVADANGVALDLAKRILMEYVAEVKTPQYEHLEQDRQFIFPNYNHNYFQVWEQYLTRAVHRLQAIKEFGQMND